MLHCILKLTLEISYTHSVKSKSKTHQDFLSRLYLKNPKVGYIIKGLGNRSIVRQDVNWFMWQEFQIKVSISQDSKNKQYPVISCYKYQDLSLHRHVPSQGTICRGVLRYHDKHVSNHSASAHRLPRHESVMVWEQYRIINSLSVRAAFWGEKNVEMFLR